MALLAVAVTTEAQQAKKPRTGFLQPGGSSPAYREAFRKGLHQLGYVEGENVLVEYRLAKGLKELPTRVAELVGLKVDVIVTWTTPGTLAATQAIVSPSLGRKSRACGCEYAAPARFGPWL